MHNNKFQVTYAAHTLHNAAHTLHIRCMYAAHTLHIQCTNEKKCHPNSLLLAMVHPRSKNIQPKNRQAGPGNNPTGRQKNFKKTGKLKGEESNIHMAGKDLFKPVFNITCKRIGCVHHKSLPKRKSKN